MPRKLLITLKDDDDDDEDEEEEEEEEYDDAWPIRFGGIGLLVVGGWVMLFMMLTGGFQKEKRVFTDALEREQMGQRSEISADIIRR